MNITNRLIKVFVYLLLSSMINVSMADTDEYEVKAAFLYNLARMVDWPDEINTEFVWCFLGKDRFGNSVDVIKSKQIKKRSLLIKKDISLSDVDVCHLLFISDSEKKNFSHILSTIKGLPILTVADVGDFVKQGGMISLMTKDQKIQIKVNLTAVEAVKLKVSSKLLALADIVE